MVVKNSPVALTPNRALLKAVLGILISWFFIGILIFFGAGRFNWGLGWLFFALWGLLKIIFLLLLRWHDPALLVERATHHTNTQPYDRRILPVYFVLAFGAILVGGLDGGRFLWSPAVPPALILCGYIIYLFGNLLAAWAAGSNPFFSSESRLQVERGQQVARQGPYRFIRHPAYLAAILMWPVTGLLLNSWWAVLPGILAAGTMFLRTLCEDRMLQAELPGYADYARQVRFRLLPGIW